MEGKNLPHSSPLDAAGGPPDNDFGNPLENNYYTMFKNVGIPVLASIAMYLAYKRFF